MVRMHHKDKSKVLEAEAEDHRYGASASRGMPVYSPAFAGAH